jgi:fructose-bisphosphate aldolase class 1
MFHEAYKKDFYPSWQKSKSLVIKIKRPLPILKIDKGLANNVSCQQSREPDAP